MIPGEKKVLLIMGLIYQVVVNTCNIHVQKLRYLRYVYGRNGRNVSSIINWITREQQCFDTLNINEHEKPFTWNNTIDDLFYVVT